MTPCEETILNTIREMTSADGIAVNVRAISRKAYVSERHTRRCMRVIDVELQKIIRFIEPGKPARIVIKSKEY